MSKILDRKILILPEKVDFDTYKSRLEGLQFKEKITSTGNTIEFKYKIDWNNIEIPPQDAESPMLKTTFNRDNIIYQQLLTFRSPFAAQTLFELFSASSYWKPLSIDKTPRIQSVDNKYVMTFMPPLSYDDDHILMILYKSSW